MSQYRIDIAFYVEADTRDDALASVEDGLSAELSNYDLIDWTLIS